MIRTAASIILPTFNEAGHVVELIDALKTHVPPPAEMIVVDDASPDGTADLISALKDPVIRIIRRRERGLVTAIQQGIAAAQGDIIAWLDADFSHPPEVAGQLIELIRHNVCDVAIASRFAPGGGESIDPFDSWPARAQKRASSSVNHNASAMVKPCLHRLDQRVYCG